MDEREMTEQEQHIAEALRYWLMAQREPQTADYHLSDMDDALNAAGVPRSTIGVTLDAYNELLGRGSRIKFERNMLYAQTATHNTLTMVLGRAQSALSVLSGIDGGHEDEIKAMRMRLQQMQQ